jgi:hypothetical protein
MQNPVPLCGMHLFAHIKTWKNPQKNLHLVRRPWDSNLVLSGCKVNALQPRPRRSHFNRNRIIYFRKTLRMRRPLVVRLDIFFKRKCVKMKDLTEITSKCFTDFFVNTVETCGGKMKNNTYYGNEYNIELKIPVLFCQFCLITKCQN